MSTLSRTLRPLAAVVAVSGLSMLTLLAQGGVPAPDDPRQLLPQQRPSFSAGTVLVPVAVRVIDSKTGKPLTDLQRDDFTLLENGLPQQVGHFERRAFTPDAAPQPGTKPPIRETALGLAPQNGRIILLVFGRGRLQEPSRALDALQRFVREQLLPQDQVAVFAYDRATDFTTDHEQVAQFIERFKKAHYDIDMEVRLAIESSMAAVYGSKALSKGVRQKIDNMFTGPGLLGSRELGKGETDASKRTAEEAARQVGVAQRAEIAETNNRLYVEAVKALGADYAGPPPAGWTSLDEIQTPQFATLGLDNFMQVTARSLQDLGNCYAAIEYLRHLEGDKHLVFVTERGMNLPRLEDDMDLTRVANDARVAIDTFQVGGLEGQQGGYWTDQSQQTFAFRGLRLIAEQTGGVSSISEDGMTAVNRINELSKSEYLIGYYPSQTRFDGQYPEDRGADAAAERDAPLSARLLRHHRRQGLQPPRGDHAGAAVGGGRVQARDWRHQAEARRQAGEERGRSQRGVGAALHRHGAPLPVARRRQSNRRRGHPRGLLQRQGAGGRPVLPAGGDRPLARDVRQGQQVGPALQREVRGDAGDAPRPRGRLRLPLRPGGQRRPADY